MTAKKSGTPWKWASLLLGGLAWLGFVVFAVLAWLFRPDGPVPWKLAAIWTGAYAFLAICLPFCTEGRQRIFGMDLGAEYWKWKNFEIKVLLVVFPGCALAYAILCLTMLALGESVEWLSP